MVFPSVRPETAQVREASASTGASGISGQAVEQGDRPNPSNETAEPWPRFRAAPQADQGAKVKLGAVGKSAAALVYAARIRNQRSPLTRTQAEHLMAQPATG